MGAESVIDFAGLDSAAAATTDSAVETPVTETTGAVDTPTTDTTTTTTDTNEKIEAGKAKTQQ